MSENDDSVRKHLRSCLVSAKADKLRALRDGDDEGAVYAAGKESAFITAIDALDGVR